MSLSPGIKVATVLISISKKSIAQCEPSLKVLNFAIFVIFDHYHKILYREKV